MQGAAQLVLAGVGDILDGGGLLQHQIGLGDDLLPQRCGLDPGLGPLEQGNPQFFLQFLDRDAEGRLTDKTALGRATEMLFLSEGYDIAQFC